MLSGIPPEQRTETTVPWGDRTDGLFSSHYGSVPCSGEISKIKYVRTPSEWEHDQILVLAMVAVNIFKSMNEGNS